MSEEFKKEEINGEAAEETKAAEHTEEVKAETTAEQSAACLLYTSPSPRDRG